MKIVIADDHALVREGISHILKGCEGVGGIIEAPTHDDLLTILDTHADIGLILLDINMSEVTTTETLVDLRKRVPTAAIAILSATEDPAVARDFLDNGAAGYLPKSSSNEVLLNAVRLIIAGGVYVPLFMLSDKQGDKQQAPSFHESFNLTARQYKVLELMAKGLTNKDIADELNLSESTVKTHVSAVLQSLDVDNRMKAVNKAIKLGLVVE